MVRRARFSAVPALMAISAGHTFQSHVLGCRAGLAVLDIMDREQLVANCDAQGVQLENLLTAKLSNHPHVGNIRLAKP